MHECYAMKILKTKKTKKKNKKKKQINKEEWSQRIERLSIKTMTKRLN